MTTFAEFERNLEEDFQNETSGNFKRFLVSQCNAGREEAEDVDDGKAEEDAQQIYDVGSAILFHLLLAVTTQFLATNCRRNIQLFFASKGCYGCLNRHPKIYSRVFECVVNRTFACINGGTHAPARMHTCIQTDTQ